jgi:hypothetical protein
MIITNSNNVIAMTILRPSRDASLGRIREGVPSGSWCLRRGGVPDLTPGVMVCFREIIPKWPKNSG